MEIKDFVSVEERILQLVRLANETEWENDRWVILGEPSPREVKVLNALLGCDVSGFQRMIDISAVKHSRKKHPNMTEADFCLIPMIIAAADEISLGKFPDTRRSIKPEPHLKKMRFRKSFSAICCLMGRDAVRPERAETTLQIYTFFIYFL